MHQQEKKKKKNEDSVKDHEVKEKTKREAISQLTKLLESTKRLQTEDKNDMDCKRVPSYQIPNHHYP